jgi:hypothetical protein
MLNQDPPRLAAAVSVLVTLHLAAAAGVLLAGLKALGSSPSPSWGFPPHCQRSGSQCMPSSR